MRALWPWGSFSSWRPRALSARSPRFRTLPPLHPPLYTSYRAVPSVSLCVVCSRRVCAVVFVFPLSQQVLQSDTRNLSRSAVARSVTRLRKTCFAKGPRLCAPYLFFCLGCPVLITSVNFVSHFPVTFRGAWSASATSRPQGHRSHFPSCVRRPRGLA